MNRTSARPLGSGLELSLTFIRMVSIFVSLAGLGVSLEAKLFMGWFGPRGLASIVFGVIVLNANLRTAAC